MPVKTISVRQCDKPWITEEIKQMIRNKNKLHKKAKIFNTDQSWKSFRQIRNDLTYAIRKRKLDYLEDLDNRASSSATFGTKNWWKLVKSFMSNKGSDPDVIPPLEKDGVTYYTNKEKATILNQFFINQSTIEDNDVVPDVPELLTSINQIHLSVEEVKNTLTKLSTAKATGPDQIHNIILKNSAGIISEPLTFLFNRSLNEGIFPTVRKTAHVTLIHKKGNKCNGAEWSKDKTQAAESIKWRPQQAYGSDQFLLVQPQTVFSTHTKSSRSRIDKRTARATGNTRYSYSKNGPLDHKMADNCVFPGPHKYTFLYNN